MKKWTMLFLMTLFALALISCGAEAPETDSETSENTEETVTDQATDGSHKTPVIGEELQKEDDAYKNTEKVTHCYLDETVIRIEYTGEKKSSWRRGKMQTVQAGKTEEVPLSGEDFFARPKLPADRAVNMALLYLENEEAGEEECVLDLFFMKRDADPIEYFGEKVSDTVLENGSVASLHRGVYYQNSREIIWENVIVDVGLKDHYVVLHQRDESVIPFLEEVLFSDLEKR